MDDSYADDEIELFSILVKQVAEINNAEEHLLKFLGKYIFMRSKFGRTSLDSNSIMIWHASNANSSSGGHGASGALYTMLFKQMAIMWLKALKFEALAGRFSQWQEEHEVQSQQALVIEQMLSSFKGLQSPSV